ncbi:MULTISPECIES: isoprenyl transferase [unclassified Pseudoclavibacter]|uniref:isoprenyl transferase n=1 Tax=unclassified Pseudoclavibacter TaxID=2615177 RepID=UPI0013018A68|nr:MULTISPECIES: isoprenyl transferase [unclassified Pseudoclavibacter]KAB1657131.1 isoprenyl transferase [Pseudoclavibacter sp. CFCC 11306]KAB1659945.1 isoprenyl transferase [Pseudoclavibacter sp. CFCC 13796]KAB1663092.1 isoprenyl transferase [Pseudoclavibacter sp. CFCC 13611]
MSSTAHRTPLLYRIYERRLEKQLRQQTPPQHVAVILDGNRRWAQKQNSQAATGHRAGAAVIREFLGWCDGLGIGIVTLYLLSTDNLSHRGTDELTQLIQIIIDLTDEISRCSDWRIHHVGSIDDLPRELVEALQSAEARTADATGMQVNLAVGYGGRREIVDAVRLAARDWEDQGRSLAQFAAKVSESEIASHLYTGSQPDPDLILRTSGEQRLSDFLLWQAAHSEFYFADVLWPDFRRVDFLRALRAYALRQRRFGS